MPYIASNGQDLFNVFYPLGSGTQISSDTGYLSGAQDLRAIFRSVIDGSPAAFDTGYQIQDGTDLRDVFAVLGSITTTTPTASPTATPTTTPTFTPTPTPTPTPIPTTTPTPTITGPSVTLSVVESNIFYGDPVHMSSTADDGGTSVVPDNHNFEFKFGPANPPSGSYADAVTFTPSTPTDVRNGVAYTPVNGAAYYQFRAYADYSGHGRIYSPESQVVFAQAVAVPSFQFNRLLASGTTRYDDVNALTVVFYFNSPGTVQVTINPGAASERFPVIVSGGLVSDFIITPGAKVYNVAAGFSFNTIKVKSIGFDAKAITVDVQSTSIANFTMASVQCLGQNSVTPASLQVFAINGGSVWHTRSRNCSTNANTDSGSQTGTGVTIAAPAVTSEQIVFAQINHYPDGFDGPSLNATTQLPFDLNGCGCNSGGWVRNTTVNIYDPRLNYSNDVNQQMNLTVANAHINTDASNRGACVGAWVDLTAGNSGTAGGSSPTSILVTTIVFTMHRGAAGDYVWDQSYTFSSAGVRADYWFSGAVFLRDRNNPTYGWFFPSNFGGGNYPFHIFNFAWADWGNNNHSIYLFRTGANGVNVDGFNIFGFPGAKIPNYDAANEVLIYGQLPTDLQFWAQAGGRLSGSPYRNSIIWLSPIG